MQHTNSRIRDENQAVLFATYQSLSLDQNQAAFVDVHTNFLSHELVTKMRRQCLTHEVVMEIRRLVLTTHELKKSPTRAKNPMIMFQHTITRTHELVLKIRRPVLTTHELTESGTRDKNQAVVFETHELTNS